jgi:hypothetical protein
MSAVSDDFGSPSEETLDLTTTVFRYKVGKEEREANIYSKVWFLNQLDDFSILTLTVLSLFGSGRSLPGILIKPKIQQAKDGSGVNVISGNVIGEEKAELAKIFRLGESPTPGQITQKRLVQVFKGFVLCLKFVFFIAKIRITGKSFDESVSAVGDIPTKNFILSLYQEMRNDTTFVEDFRDFYDQLVKPEREDSDFVTTDRDVAFFLSIPTMKDSINLADPKNARLNKPIQEYVKILYRWRRFLEKLRFFLEPLVSIPANYIATISTTVIQPSATILVFTKFTQEALPSLLGRPIIAGPGSPVWKRGDPFPMLKGGVESGREQEIFDKRSLESEISNLRRQLQASKASEEDAITSLQDISESRDRLSAEFQKCKVAYERKVNELAAQRTVQGSSSSPADTRELTRLKEMLANVQKAHSNMNRELEEKNQMISELQGDFAREKQMYDDLNLLYKRTISPSVFDDTVFLKLGDFTTPNIVRDTNWYRRHIFFQLVKAKPGKEFYDELMSLNDSIESSFRHEFILQGDICSGIGGVQYLTWLTGEIKRYLETHDVARKFPQGLFDSLSTEWMFGGFSIEKLDSRFISPILVRMINDRTQADITRLVFLRRVLFAKTVIDLIVTGKYAKGENLLDQVYKKLLSQTNEGVVDNIFRLKTESIDFTFLPLLIGDQKTVCSSSSTKKTVRFQVTPSPSSSSSPLSPTVRQPDVFSGFP